MGFAPHFRSISMREGLIAVVALAIVAQPATAENAKDLKYALECGAAKITPPEDDSDPIYKTKIAVTDKLIYVVHYAASGETYIRNEQYRNQRFWGQEKTDNWSGVSIRRPDWTMVGTSPPAVGSSQGQTAARIPVRAT
jgi:hypothetical protein